MANEKIIESEVHDEIEKCERCKIAGMLTGISLCGDHRFKLLLSEPQSARATL